MSLGPNDNVTAVAAMEEAYEGNECPDGQVLNAFKSSCQQGIDFPTFKPYSDEMYDEWWIWTLKQVKALHSIYF